VTPEHPTARVADTAAIRAHFPALERQHHGRPVAYFDGPGGTQVPRAVVDAVARYLFHHNANTHWAYPTSEETDALLAAARHTFGEFLGCDADEVAFGANMTTLLFHVARAIGRTLAPGDEIIVTELDHHANIAPWQALARERGAVLRWVPLDVATSHLDFDAFVRALSPRTRVVAVGAASNALGTISDVRSLIAMAKPTGALTVVDAVHYAPHHLVDVRALDCDVLACSAYKFYGPHVGVLHVRRRVLEALDVPRLEPAPDTGGERLETGTQNHEGIVGAAAAVDFLASLAPADVGARRERLAVVHDALHRRGEELVARLWEGVATMPWVRPVGPPPGTQRTATVSLRVEGGAERAAVALARLGLFASHGDFYASTVARRLGTVEEGLLRVGCMAYTTAEEIDRLLEALHGLRP
jgi:cysteine desulfurase family protein (TIGR01976 family)